MFLFASLHIFGGLVTVPPVVGRSSVKAVCNDTTHDIHPSPFVYLFSPYQTTKTPSLRGCLSFGRGV